MTDLVIPESFDELSVDELTALSTQIREAGVALAALDAPTDDDLAAADILADGLDRIVSELDTRATAAAERAERAAALKTRFTVEETEEVVEEAAEDEVEEAVEEVVEEAAVKPAKTTVASLAKKVPRPATTKKAPMVTITAAADVPDFSTGQALDGMAQVAQALVARMKGFGTPSGNGETENLQHYGVAKFKMDFPEELTVKPHSDDTAVLNYAGNESRLEGKSLVASGGWCAPSETLYDLCVTETLDGLLSIPEVNITRGGIKFTKGPDFSAIYDGVGFLQTEAQAISGTTKTCYEVVCPSFTDVRLDAIGVCIKAPILTNAAYPELVQRVLSGSMVAHAHKVNASVIGRIVTAAGTALAVTDFSSAAQSTFSALELVAQQIRQSYKLAIDSTMEVVVPYWIKAALRDDLAFRTGRDVTVITDQMIAAEFAARHLNVQYVYDWQEPAVNVVIQGYPATFQALVYPAG